jgi:hypothetical protein
MGSEDKHKISGKIITISSGDLREVVRLCNYNFNQIQTHFNRVANNQAAPRFRAYPSGAQNGVTTRTKINYGTESEDTHGWYDTTNSRYLPLKRGIYLFRAGVYNTPGTGESRFVIDLGLNGTAVRLSGREQTTSDAHNQITAWINMNGTSDYVEAFFTSVDGYSVNLSSAVQPESSYFSGVWIAHS